MPHLLDKASILLTPTAYSEGVIHTIKPNTSIGDFDFTRATTSTRVNLSGVIESVPSNLPRIDYSNGVGSIILEPSSTNLFTNSSTLLSQNITTTSGVYTISFYGTGSITLSGTNSSTINGTGLNQRVSFTFTATSGILNCAVVGNVINAQIEQKSFSTSYISTDLSPATRNREQLSGAGDSSLINSLEGAIYGEIASFTNSGEPERNISLSDSTSNNTAEIGYSSGANLVRFRLRANNSTILAQNFPIADSKEFVKLAMKYKSGEIKCFVNGVEAISNTSSFTYSQSLKELAFDRGNGTNSFTGRIKSIAAFSGTITDDELICLTQ